MIVKTVKERIEYARAVLGPNVPASVTDQGARWEWQEALNALDLAHAEITAFETKLLLGECTDVRPNGEGRPVSNQSSVQFGCNGPEGSFWADDLRLANELIRHTYDRDEWTVTFVEDAKVTF